MCDVPPCDASCPRSEWEEELLCGMSSVGPNLKRGTPATWGELKERIPSRQTEESKTTANPRSFCHQPFSSIYLNKRFRQFLTLCQHVRTYWMAWSRPSERCGTTRVGVLGTILSSSSKKCCCRWRGGKTLFRKISVRHFTLTHGQ